MAYGGSTGRRVCGESTAVLGCGLASAGAALSCLGGAVLGRGGLDCGAGPATTMDEGLATHQTRNHFINLIIQIQKMIGDLI